MAVARGKPRAQGRARTARRPPPPAAPRPLAPEEIAWLVLLPVAAVVLLAIVVLGPPLGRLLYPEQTLSFWPLIRAIIRPEPTEQARFLIALSGPVLLAGATILLARRPPSLLPATAARLTLAVQLVGALTILVCLIVQYSYRFGPLYTVALSSARTVYFTIPTLLVAALIAGGGGALLLRRRDLVARALAATAETLRRRLAALAGAVLLVVVWMLAAIYTEDTLGRANLAVLYHVQFTFDETYAVLDGRSPLVDFAAQYGSLWPYPVAGGMSLLGDSIGVLTVLMSTITGLTMVATFGIWRRVTRSSLLALALFAPFLATSFFMMRGPLENRYALVNLLGAFPLRYAGPLLVAWMLARHLDGARPRRAWPIFTVAGLAAMNNADLGIAALGAALVALLLAGGAPTRRSLLTLAANVVVGLALAFALVSALTLARGDTLPHFDLLFRYSRLFIVAGFGMLPMKPTIGVATLIYLTHVGAIATAAVRAVRGEPNRLLTGLLAWAGIFGLGAGAYYIGRSHPEVLTNTFPGWALSVGLLTVVAVGSLARAERPRLAIPQLAVLFAFGVTVCSLAQTPTPWSQIDRLSTPAETRLMKPIFGERFVDAHTDPGEPVLLLMLMGHRMAVDLDLENMSSYSGIPSIPSIDQFTEVLEALVQAGGTKVFLDNVDRVSGQSTIPQVYEALPQLGFRKAASAVRGELTMWVYDPARTGR